jgi:hypothetical protein
MSKPPLTGPLPYRLRPLVERALLAVRWLRGRRELALVLTLATLAGGTWVFLEIAGAVTTG